jgi:hypothetical protein
MIQTNTFTECRAGRERRRVDGAMGNEAAPARFHIRNVPSQEPGSFLEQATFLGGVALHLT